MEHMRWYNSSVLHLQRTFLSCLYDAGELDSLSEIHLIPNALPHTDTFTLTMKHDTEGCVYSRRALHIVIQCTALRRKDSLTNS